MAKKDKLDKSSTKRLEKLGEQWEERSFRPEKITVSDLRLLLENFPPLQALICQIAASAGQLGEVAVDVLAPIDFPNDAAPSLQRTQALEDATQALAQKDAQLAQLQAQIGERDASLEKLQEKATQVADDLKKCKATVEKLQKEKEGAKEEIKTLKDERNQLHKNWQQTQNELASAQARARTVPELALLRSDPQLAQDMGLGELHEDDTQALIQVVAVLSQLDSLTRLWDRLMKRCEADNRLATESEHALLQTALEWHNHNWLSKPYCLLNVAEGSRYDYGAQLRSSNTPKGETVAALLLPGIASHAGEALCKPLVRLR